MRDIKSRLEILKQVAWRVRPPWQVFSLSDPVTQRFLSVTIAVSAPACVRWNAVSTLITRISSYGGQC